MLRHLAQKIANLDQHQRVGLADLIDSPNPDRQAVADELEKALQAILPELAETKPPPPPKDTV